MYVGQTVRTVRRRLSEHLSEATGPNPKVREYPVYRWIRKHGKSNILAKTLEVVDRSFLDDCEIAWVSNIDSYNRKDKLNQTPGGGSTGFFDNEVRSRMSESAARRWRDSSPEERENRVQVLRRIAGSANRGVPMSPEQKAKLSELAKQRPPVTEETKEKMRAAWAVTKRLPVSGPGSQNGRATISEETALTIHERLQSGEKASQVARDLGLAYHIVSEIKRGGSWNHVTGLPKPTPRRKNG